MSATIQYTLDGRKIRIIGLVDRLYVGYVQVEASYGDEVYETDGPVEVFSDDQLFETPPTTVLDERVAKLQQTIKTMEEAIGRNRHTLAEQERERENHKRWLREHQAWLDAQGLMEGRLTYRAEFEGTWGNWSITNISATDSYKQDCITMKVSRKGSVWEWMWAKAKDRNNRWDEQTHLFESKETAVAWVESKLANLNMRNIDLRRAREIAAKCQEHGVRCPFHIIEFIEQETERKRQKEERELRERLAKITA